MKMPSGFSLPTTLDHPIASQRVVCFVGFDSRVWEERLMMRKGK